MRPIRVCWLAVIFGWSGYTVTSADVLEPGELARAARSYRLQVYTTYRSDRAEFNHRTRQAQRILDDWRQRGSPADEEQRLIRWYVEATRASRPDHVRPLPEYPHAVELRRPQRSSPSGRIANSGVKPHDTRTAPPQRQRQGVSMPPARRSLPQRERRPNPVVARPTLVATSSSVATTNTDTGPVRDRVAASPVNLAILTSRIRSFNLTLTEIEGELSRPGPWRVDQLAVLIDHVERLLSRRQLSQLYYDALTPRQQQLVEGLASVDLTLALLDQRLFEARVALIDANSGRNPPSGQGEMKQLRSLSSRIKSWTVLPESKADEQ